MAMRARGVQEIAPTSVGGDAHGGVVIVCIEISHAAEMARPVLIGLFGRNNMSARVRSILAWKPLKVQARNVVATEHNLASVNAGERHASA